MPRISYHIRKSVVALRKAGYSIVAIHKRLAEEGVSVSLRSLQKLYKKFSEHGCLLDLPRRKRSKKLTPEMEEMTDEEMRKNDELTAQQLRTKLKEKFPSLQLSLSTVKVARRRRGWVCTKPHYCQILRAVNKTKRLEWCQKQLEDEEDFSEVIFTDECTVQLDHHSRICFRKNREPRALKQKAKHPAKVHIWGGISYKGATKIVIFTGNMNAPRYAKILESSLLPFIKECYPRGHKLQQDNDPKHTSKYVEKFFEQHNVTWWKTPPESPDLNPIENLWGSLKQYLRTTYKPMNLEELKQGIQRFWMSLTPDVCQRYIGHLHKVIPKVIEVGGNPSGY